MEMFSTRLVQLTSHLRIDDIAQVVPERIVSELDMIKQIITRT